MSKALTTPYLCLQTLLIRMHCKSTKNNRDQSIYKLIFSEKLCFYGKSAPIMAGNNRQTVKSIECRDRNNVFSTKKNGKKGLWHDYCISQKRKMSETTFLA